MHRQQQQHYLRKEKNKTAPENYVPGLKCPNNKNTNRGTKRSINPVYYLLNLEYKEKKVQIWFEDNWAARHFLDKKKPIKNEPSKLIEKKKSIGNILFVGHHPDHR